MSHLDISRTHTLGLHGARQAADAVAERLQADFGAVTEWKDDRLQVKARGVQGEITVTDTLVHVSARLGLAARPFRNLLRREIEEELDRSLSQTA